MKGNISLKDFITDVKKELKSAINNEDPFFLLGDVELEVSFALNAKAKGSAKLVVVDVGGDVEAAQTHKVKLTLTPFVEESTIQVGKKLQQPAKASAPKLRNRTIPIDNKSKFAKVKVGSGSGKQKNPDAVRKPPTMKR
ncbi:hypothetical protein P3576_20200 [Vibrio parahaemolyticus]|uniref:trypco2 family protein n=2 Tax=Vibrio parahaemolyticus TaxID=670 RepID=UPI001123AB85|nr:trypco2 family protein [Vibrio parahaemolyticus]MBE3958653.1 hypothetical protein [Vibrio parahaemolyticus]MBE3967697.1 hypothetical protein [Vibrio parahaemolyticus]MBE3998796.1 hypothetical protein [Vibrio parahaemolyticus]MBE4017072.1 hypothetical protein [Vibrio parahaemolyticus]MBE4025795.1 hypothetical protein [Vibrio parahaemolyticus]